MQRHKAQFAKMWRLARILLPWVQGIVSEVTFVAPTTTGGGSGGGGSSLEAVSVDVGHVAVSFASRPGKQQELQVLVKAAPLQAAVQVTPGGPGGSGGGPKVSSQSVPFVDLSDLYIEAGLRPAVGGRTATCASLHVRLGDVVLLLSRAVVDMAATAAAAKAASSSNGACLRKAFSAP